MTTKWFLWGASAYFSGAIPTAYLAGRFFRGIDIRQHGSGNVGATNAFRVLGKGPGSVVFFIDFLKGALPVYLSARVLTEPVWGLPAALLVGVLAIAGHVFTPFLGFKGGKGIATGGGVLCAVFPTLFLITISAWSVCFFITRIVSLSSLVCVVVLFISSIFLRHDNSIRVFFALIVLFVFWTHRANIGRLLRGEEKKKQLVDLDT